MKNLIKVSLIIAMFAIFVGSIGAYDNNTISALRCILQCGLCTLGSYIILKGWCK